MSNVREPVIIINPCQDIFFNRLFNNSDLYNKIFSYIDKNEEYYDFNYSCKKKDLIIKSEIILFFKIMKIKYKDLFTELSHFFSKIKKNKKEMNFAVIDTMKCKFKIILKKEFIVFDTQFRENYIITQQDIDKFVNTNKIETNAIEVNSPFYIIDFYNSSSPTTLYHIFINNNEYYKKIQSAPVCFFGNRFYLFNETIFSFLNKINTNFKYITLEKEIIYYLKDKWRKYKKNNSDKKNIFDDAEIHYKTLEGDIKWEEIVSARSYRYINEKYNALYKNEKLLLEVEGTRKFELNKMMAKITLYKSNKICANVNVIQLYNAVKKQIQEKAKNYKFKDNKIDRQIKNENIVQKIIEENYIRRKDVLIKNAIFKCFFLEHIVQEILGVIQILTSSGEIITLKVPCAYCEKCNCYYMLKSEFDKIRTQGVILCQVLSSKKYYEHGISDSVYFGTGESILKMNGYNVIASQNLSDIQRKMILKNIIDNNILQAHEIASYLNTFISLKLELPQYKDAVEKWAKDKEFVLQYKNILKNEENIEVIKL